MGARTKKKEPGIGMLLVRAVAGTLIAGHGAQKLFGWFGGPGLPGFEGFAESIGLKPAKLWAVLAGLSEFVGGILTILGFLNPFGPLAAIAAMVVATAKVHWGKPIWASEGGAELALTNAATAAAVAIEGPGRYSLDRALGIRLPLWMRALAFLGTAAALVGAIKPFPATQKVGHVRTSTNE